MSLMHQNDYMTFLSSFPPKKYFVPMGSFFSFDPLLSCVKIAFLFIFPFSSFQGLSFFFFYRCFFPLLFRFLSFFYLSLVSPLFSIFALLFCFLPYVVLSSFLVLFTCLSSIAFLSFRLTARTSFHLANDP